MMDLLQLYWILQRLCRILNLFKLYAQYKIKRNADEDIQIMLDTLGKRICFPETISVINRLREIYRVVIGSTTDNKPLYDDMKRNGLSVDNVYTSEMIGKYKPDSRFYSYILEQEKCKTEHANSVKPWRIIESLEQLENILKRECNCL